MVIFKKNFKKPPDIQLWHVDCLDIIQFFVPLQL